MIKDLKNTFRQTATYGLANIMVKVAGLLLLPIYTSSLSTEEYGVLVTLEVIAQFFVGVISFHIPGSMLRLGSDIDDPHRQKRVYSTALMMLLAIAGAFLAIALPFHNAFSHLLFQGEMHSSYFVILSFSIAAEMLGTLPMQWLRLKERSRSYLLIFTLKFFSMLGFVWFFVQIQDKGVWGALMGILLSNLSLLAATLFIQIRQFTRKFDRQTACEMYHYGGPLIFTTVSGVILTISDRLIIKIYGQFSEVGIYALAYKVGSVSRMLVISSFGLGFLPIAFRKYRESNFKRFFSKTFTYFLGAIVLLSLVVSLFSQEAIKLISSNQPTYWLAFMLVPFIAYAFIFKGLQNYLAYSFLLTRQTRFHAYITISGALVNVALNFALIPFYGMYGAVAATFLSYVIMVMITYRLAQSKLRIHYEIKRVLLLLLSCALLMALGIFCSELNLTWRIIIKILLIVSFVLFVFYGVGDKTERHKVYKMFRLLKTKGGVSKVIDEIIF